MSYKKRYSALISAIQAYVKKFEKKHNTSFEDFVGDDVIGIVIFGDCYFNMSDIIYDIDTKQHKEMIWDWYYATLDRGMEEKSTINYKSWCKGLRYTDLND